MHYTGKKTNKEADPAPKTVKKVIRKESIIPEQSVTLRAEEPRVRYLKVQPVFRRLTQQVSFIPELRLKGRWLEEAGFCMASYASITVMDGLLIIRSRGLVNDRMIE